MVRLYQLTHNAALLGSAEGIMAFEMAGWQEPPASRARAASRSPTGRRTANATR